MGYAQTVSSISIEVSGTITNQVTITNAPGTTAIGTITLPTLRGNIDRVIMELKILQLRDTSGGVNSIAGTGLIQIEDSGATYRTGITWDGAYIQVAANGYADGEFVVSGNTDLKAYVASGQTYNLRWKDHQAVANNILANGVNVKLKIYFQ